MIRSARTQNLVFLFLASLSSSQMVRTAAARVVSIIPKPVRIEVLDGDFRMTPATVIVAGKAVVFEGRQLSTMLWPATGFALQVVEKARAGVPVIELKLDPALEKLGEEG